MFQPLNIFKQPYRLINNQRTLCIHRTRDGRLLYGDNFGVYELNKNSRKIKGINSRIKKILETPEGLIACCSDINGIYFINGEHIQHYSITDGLISNNVNSAVFDGKGNLWVATNKGLSYINNLNGTVQNFGITHGLIYERINDLCLLEEDKLLLASISGVYSFSPLKNIKLKSPVLKIENVKVNGRLYPIKNLTKLPYNQNQIEILLQAISYQDNHPEFFYSINNQSWIKINGRQLTFIDLPSGNYSIKIKCRNLFGQWSNTSLLNINVLTPLYKTWWFILTIIALLIFAVLLYVRYRTKRRNKSKEIQLLLSETKEKALRAQLNPHFIFNALNSIQYLYLSHKEELAIEYLNKFSVLLRNTLNFSARSFISINDEIENLKLYLEIEKLRTGNKFEYEINIDANVDSFSTLMPSMFIQPFVENAVWHAFSSIQYKGFIQININLMNSEKFQISVVDNGIGFSPENLNSKNTSMGLKLIKDRIVAINAVNNESISLSIISNEKGTQVFLIFPIKY